MAVNKETHKFYRDQFKLQRDSSKQQVVNAKNHLTEFTVRLEFVTKVEAVYYLLSTISVWMKRAPEALKKMNMIEAECFVKRRMNGKADKEAKTWANRRP